MEWFRRIFFCAMLIFLCAGQSPFNVKAQTCQDSMTCIPSVDAVIRYSNGCVTAFATITCTGTICGVPLPDAVFPCWVTTCDNGTTFTSGCQGLN